MKDKKLLITGGAGFIGSNLAETLSGENEVLVYDDLSTGKMANIEDLDITFIRGSITERKSLDTALEGVDYVFHLAALPSVPRSIREPDVVNNVNITGTLNVLMAAKASCVKKVVFAASSSAYGDTPTLPKEETMPPNPLSPYAITKLTGELYCNVFYRIYGLPTTSVRYFNVYGPKQNPDSEYAAVIPRFIKNIQEGTPPTIFGDGEQTRDFTYVKDAVNGTILAARLGKSDGTVINLAGGNRISINHLVVKLGKLLGKSVTPVYMEPRTGDVKHSLASIARAREFLGYEPQNDIDSGLRDTVDYFTKTRR